MNLYACVGRMGSCVAIVATLVLSLAATQTHAGTFSWGDYSGPEVMYLDVTENNNEANSLFAPMPGSGGPTLVGNSLRFDPQNFASQSQNNSADLLDSQLSTVIMALPGNGLNSISISELGDYSLGGLVGGQASASVGAAFFWTVLEVDNLAVNLSTQATNLILSTGSGPNGGQYHRPDDDGTSVIWNGTADIDLNSYLLSEQIAGCVTKLRLTFDNTLQTSADDVSTAFIKKKAIEINVDTSTKDVPEPTAALLLGLGFVLIPGLRRR